MKAGLSLLFFSLATSLAQAATHIVKINGGEQVTFIPSQISAAVGDILEFHILGDVFPFFNLGLIVRFPN